MRATCDESKLKKRGSDGQGRSQTYGSKAVDYGGRSSTDLHPLTDRQSH